MVELKRNPSSGIKKLLQDDLKRLEEEQKGLKEKIKRRKEEIETSQPEYFQSRRGHLSEINGGKSNNLIISELMLGEDSKEPPLDPRTPALSGILHFDNGPGFLDSVLKKQLGDGVDNMREKATKIVSEFQQESKRYGW